jgi:hypothetical protein
MMDPQTCGSWPGTRTHSGTCPYLCQTTATTNANTNQLSTRQPARGHPRSMANPRYGGDGAQKQTTQGFRRRQATLQYSAAQQQQYAARRGCSKRLTHCQPHFRASGSRAISSAWCIGLMQFLHVVHRSYVGSEHSHRVIVAPNSPLLGHSSSRCSAFGVGNHGEKLCHSEAVAGRFFHKLAASPAPPATEPHAGRHSASCGTAGDKRATNYFM